MTFADGLSFLTDSWVTPMLFFSMLSAVVVLLVERGKFLYALRNVPYPTALPIIGNAYQLNCSTEGKTCQPGTVQVSLGRDVVNILRYA